MKAVFPVPSFLCAHVRVCALRSCHRYTVYILQVVAHKNLVRLAAEDAPFDEREVLAMNQLAELLLPLMPRCPDIRDPVTLLYACAQGTASHHVLAGLGHLGDATRWVSA